MKEQVYKKLNRIRLSTKRTQRCGRMQLMVERANFVTRDKDGEMKRFESRFGENML